MPLGDLGDGDPICKEQVYRGLRWPGRDSTPFELIRGESLLSISIHQLDRQGRERVIHRAVEGAAAGALVGFMVWHGTGQLLLGGSILVFFASLGAGIGLQEAWRLPESSPLVLDRSANQVTLGGHRICRVNDVARLEHRPRPRTTHGGRGDWAKAGPLPGVHVVTFPIRNLAPSGRGS